MPTSDRERAVDAVDVLNDFIGDFITGGNVLREYAKQHHEGKLALVAMIPIQKMCISYLVLAFAKFEEFWKHYHDLVPDEHHNACKTILKTLRARKVTDFRKRCVGHIWDRKHQRPLAHSEVLNALNVIATPNLGEFLGWINNPKANVYPSTVVSVVEAVRDAVMLTHRIQPDEIVDR